MTKDIRITPIKNGTAIDHLNVGSAYKILEVLKLKDYTVTAGMGVESRKMGRKDIIFIEGKELNEKELNMIALIGKGATINIIKNSEIIKKFQLEYPKKAEGIIKCINPKCITNLEKINSKFDIKTSPLEAKCWYCEARMSEQDIIASIKSD
jgi:aspartate carbamoyltransferase regulatory subunit